MTIESALQCSLLLHILLPIFQVLSCNFLTKWDFPEMHTSKKKFRLYKNSAGFYFSLPCSDPVGEAAACRNRGLRSGVCTGLNPASSSRDRGQDSFSLFLISLSVT